MLSLENVTETDSGWYSCIAYNVIGSQESRAYLHVVVPSGK